MHQKLFRVISFTFSKTKPRTKSAGAPCKRGNLLSGILRSKPKNQKVMSDLDDEKSVGKRP